MVSTQAPVVEAEQIAHALFRTADGRQNPYPLYHRLRELAPVHYSDTARAWLLTRYEDCASALRDPRLGKDFVRAMDFRRPNWRERPTLRRFEKSMLNVDGPYHTRLRKLVSKEFTPRTVEGLRPTITAMVDEFLDGLAGDGGGDLMADVAFPLPVRVIGELLGVPEQDRAQFRDLTRDLTASFEIGATHEQLDRADEVTLFIDGYFRELIGQKRRHPGDDLLSALVAGGDEDDRLTDDELITLATLLFLAGFETTTNLLGNGMLGLLKHPDQLDMLRARPDLDLELGEELLRYDGTVQMTTRFSKEPVAFGDVTIPEGQSVFMMLGAGNHDPERYSSPDAIDLTRTKIRPLTFGGGVHFCLGAALARLEIQIFFRRLVDRFALIELDGDPPPFRDRLTLRGLAELPLILRSGAPRRTAVPATITTPDPEPDGGTEPEIWLEGVLPARPSGASDRAWRAAFRSRIEAAGADDAELGSRIDLLARVPLFAGCTPDELRRLAAGAYPIAFDQGDVLCVEGSEAPECYVIAEGEALCSIGGRTVATVGVDDVVGELGPLEGRPRAATVVASTHMITYAISREELKRLIAGSPSAAAAMREELRRKYGEAGGS